MLDTKALAAATAVIVREHVDKAVAPLLVRIGELEKTIANHNDHPQELEAFVERRMVEQRGFILTEFKGMMDESIAAIPPAQPGKDADLDEISAIVIREVEGAFAALPKPQDGKDGEKGEPGANGKDGVDGKDGAGLVDLLIDRAGELVTTLSDGRIKNVGRVVGRNGKDGAPGKDGRDGFGFEDMTEELADDGRTIIRRYSRGEDVKEFRHKLAVVLYRGVWKEGQTYDAGDNVTWGGHSWIAKEDTDAKPEPNGGPWILHVKRGRDGKDGMLKAEKPKEPVKVG